MMLSPLTKFRNIALSNRCDWAREQVAEDKSFSFNRLPEESGYRSLEHGPGVNEGVEFPVFAARIHYSGEIGEELRVEVPSREFRSQRLGIHTGDFGA